MWNPSRKKPYLANKWLENRQEGTQKEIEQAVH